MTIEYPIIEPKLIACDHECLQISLVYDDLISAKDTHNQKAVVYKYYLKKGNYDFLSNYLLSVH